MSIKTTPNVDVTTTNTDIEKSANDLSVEGSSRVYIEPRSGSVTGSKKEYSIVGDGLYAGINSEEAPQWMIDLIDSVVDQAVAKGLLDYNTLIQNVRDGIDALDVAKNTYVKSINFSSLVDGILGSKLETLNATYDDKYATIVDLDQVAATSEYSLTQRISDLQAEFNDEINSRITTIQLAYTSADQANASSIEALSSRLEDQDKRVAGNSDALSGLQTFVGVTDYNNPNGTGMLSRIDVLERQNDGVILYTTGTYDVMINVEDDQNPDDDKIDATKEPYASWIAVDNANGNENERAAHIGDVYIQYDPESGNYVKSYKFIRTAPDQTAPFSTDPQGYTWSLITDTDVQSTYVAALKASDLADQKRRVFVAQPYAPYDVGDLWVDNSSIPQVVKVSTVNRTNIFNEADWVLADETAKEFIENTYEPEAARVRNQIDGKIEYYFYESYSDIPGASNEEEALASIKSGWNTQEKRDDAHGNIVYFKDSRKAYWYQATIHDWVVVTDTSIYQALQDAAAAKGAADGKVSQFYAWGGPNSPANYVLNPEAPVTEQEVISASKFLYWFKPDDKKLYYKPVNSWVLVPVGSSETGNSYIAEGDLVTVFDPATGDTTTYSFNGATWDVTGPEGIISKSRFFVDLATDVRGPTGLVAQGFSNLEATSEAYADSVGAYVENRFAYDSAIMINGEYYKSGFGLTATGDTAGDGASEDTAFDSEFWVNAKRFVLKNPDYPSIEARFTVTESGIQLGVENTEATRNEPKGPYNSNTTYVRGDIVTFNRSSYLAVMTVKGVTPDDSKPQWQLLAEKGSTPLLFDYEGNDSWPDNTNEAAAKTYDFTSSFAGNALIRVFAYDAEGTANGGVRMKFNDGAELPFYRTRADSTEEWYEFSVNNLVTGENTLKFWATSADGGKIRKIEVAFVGAEGLAGGFTDFLFTRSTGTPQNPGGNITWYTDVTDVPDGAGDLWSIKKEVNAGGSKTTYTDKRIIEAPIIRELVLYSKPTTGSRAAPTGSKYNFKTDTLAVNDNNWSRSVPGLTTNNHKIYVSTALVTGNATQTNVSVNWSTPTIYAQRQDGVSADVYKYVYKDSLTKPSKPTGNSPTGWVTEIPALINNTLYQSIGKQTNGTGNFVWQNPTQITARDGLSALLFEWQGSQSWPVNTTIDNAYEWKFNSAFAGNVFIRINANDAEGGVRIGFNGEEITAISGPDNATRYYEVSSDTLKVGENTISVWASTGDGGSVKDIKVAFVGARGRQGVTGAYTDFLFTRSVSEPKAPDQSGAPTWYTSASASGLKGAGNLWTIKKIVSAGGETTTYEGKRQLEADLVREIVLYSIATSGTVNAPTTHFKYNFATDSLVGSHGHWSTSFPSSLPNGKKVYRTTALATGNITQTNVSLSGKWSTPSVYAYRKDGVNVTVTDNNNGTYTVTGANGSIVVKDGKSPGAPTITNNNDGTFTIRNDEGDTAIISAGRQITAQGSHYNNPSSNSYISITGYDKFNVNSRGHRLIVLDPDNGNIDYNQQYDTYGSGVVSLSNRINGLANGKIVILVSEDACRCSSILREALRGCGSPLDAVWGPERIAHAFIGTKGGPDKSAYEVVTAVVSEYAYTTATYTDNGVLPKGYTPVKGIDYFDGANGTYVSFVYRVSSSAPGKPSGGSFNGTNESVPTGWTDRPTAGINDTEYVSTTRYTATTDSNGNVTWSNNGWSTPALFYRKGESGSSADVYREVFLYRNATSTPGGKPSNTQGFNASTGGASNYSSWTTSPSTPTSKNKTYRINITLKQTNGSGNWKAVDSNWNGPLPFTGVDGENGNPGKDADSYKEIFLYANGASAPSLPGVSGSFYASSGNARDNDGWYATASNPGSNEYTYRTSLTLIQKESKGNWTNSDSSWNTAVRMTGDAGKDGKPGDDGKAGKRGAGIYYVGTSDGVWSDAIANGAVPDDTPVPGDIVNIFKISDPTVGETKKYNGSSWVGYALVINGNLLAKGSIDGEAIQANTRIVSPRIDLIGNNFMKIELASGFGPDNLWYWYGPKILNSSGVPILSSLKKSNAIEWKDTSGNSYFGGTLSAGTLTNAGRTTLLTKNPSVTVGPFTTNGNKKVIAYSYSYSSSGIQAIDPGASLKYLVQLNCRDK